ncbi:hypothetical protein J3A83DRAFT_4186235 [Scleroderma citrinum]
MGKPRIVKVGHSTPVRHVTGKVVRSGGRIIERMEWFPYKVVFLSVLHDMEAPPDPWIERWSVTCFEDFTLRLGSQMQLMRAGLFPAITRDCRTAFTFHVLNDFLLDNVECSTTAMNYYSKLCRVTSNAFLHLVPPGIIIPPGDNIDMSDYRWKYSWVIVMSGNFKAEHMALKNTDSEFWLMDGHGYMVQKQESQGLIAVTIMQSTRQMQIGVIWHLLGLAGVPVPDMGALYHMPWWTFKRGSTANPLISILEGIHIQPEIGIWHVHGHQSECFTQYAPNFIPGVGNIDGEMMETLWSSLNIISPSMCGMSTPH